MNESDQILNSPNTSGKEPLAECVPERTGKSGDVACMILKAVYGRAPKSRFGKARNILQCFPHWYYDDFMTPAAGVF